MRLTRRPTMPPSDADPPAPPRYVDALGQDADATRGTPVVPPDAPPSARTATRLLTVAVARDAGLATRGLARSARRDPTAAAAWLAIGLIVGIGVARWRLAPDAQPVYASPAQATIAATATAAAGDVSTADTRPGDVGTDAANAPTSGAMPASVARWEHEIVAAAEKHGIPARLLGCLASQESTGNPSAVSPAGAVGLFQIMPATGAELGLSAADLYDPEKSADGGARYLAQQYATYGTWPLALVAYNGGSGAVARYRAGQPYAETRAYLAAILPCAGLDGGA